MDLMRPTFFLKLRLRIKAFFLEHLFGQQMEASIRRWYADEADRRLRYMYPLNPQSVVFDVGGYRGDFAAEISQRYDCVIYIFEPVANFHSLCAARFQGKDKVFCLPFGLSDKDQTLPISVAADASGLYNPKHSSSPTEMIPLKAMVGVMEELSIRQIDLLKINIEGGEYPLLEHLLDSGLMPKIQHLQVQFHDFAESAVGRRSHIREKLSRTHSQDWCYPFVWESWSRR